MYKRGFTLVELSIVLVIIGLLIGGILVAKSMINTAKIQSFIRVIGQFDAGIANFQTKYNYLPGDANSFGCVNTAYSTCGNRIIEDNSFVGSGGGTQNFSGETANFWPDLQKSGFTNISGGNYTPTITGNFNASSANPNAPYVSVGKNTEVVIFAQSALTGIQSQAENFYFACNFDLVASNSGGGTNWLIDACTGSETIPAVDALAIDKKLDDGSANSDYSSPGFTYDGKKVIDLLSTCSDTSTGQYNVTDPNAKCGLAIQLFSINGIQN